MKKLSAIRSHNRCPKCAYRIVRRSARANGVRDISGFTLWDLTETCIMCRWLLTTANVKVGA